MFLISFIFTNGQRYFLTTDYKIINSAAYKWFRVKTDFFSNKLWDSLDEPQLYLNLVRFERRYNKKTLF